MISIHLHIMQKLHPTSNINSKLFDRIVVHNGDALAAMQDGVQRADRHPLRDDCKRWRILKFIFNSSRKLTRNELEICSICLPV